jgi:hypothetical protein
MGNVARRTPQAQEIRKAHSTAIGKRQERASFEWDKLDEKTAEKNHVRIIINNFQLNVNNESDGLDVIQCTL